MIREIEESNVQKNFSMDAGGIELSHSFISRWIVESMTRRGELNPPKSLNGGRERVREDGDGTGFSNDLSRAEHATTRVL